MKQRWSNNKEYIETACKTKGNQYCTLDITVHSIYTQYNTEILSPKSFLVRKSAGCYVAIVATTSLAYNQPWQPEQV